jgi:hypothetical protein
MPNRVELPRPRARRVLTLREKGPTFLVPAGTNGNLQEHGPVRPERPIKLHIVRTGLISQDG